MAVRAWEVMGPVVKGERMRERKGETSVGRGGSSTRSHERRG